MMSPPVDDAVPDPLGPPLVVLPPKPRVSVCIATYQRPHSLHLLLEDLVQQRLLPMEVIVVDNDHTASARCVVAQIRAVGVSFPLHYAVQPEKNISLTRNRSVELAQGDWLAFIDDDERADPEWLARLVDAARDHAADGVLGPVTPLLPGNAAAWLQRGSFYDWPRMPTGSVVPRRRLRFGNVLLSAAVLRGQDPVFDPAFGTTGGEDGDLLTRLAQSGARMVWCDQAEVTEPVAKSRLSLRWLLLRSLRGGQDFAIHSLAGRYGSPTLAFRFRLVVRSGVQLVAASILSLLSLPLGRHRSALWLTRAAANFGKLSVFFGVHYKEYG